MRSRKGNTELCAICQTDSEIDRSRVKERNLPH